MSESEGGEGASEVNDSGGGEAPGQAEPSRRQRVTHEQLEAWGQAYQTEHRQVRRWINLGREKNDPPPLDTPADMPVWWARHMRHRVPEKILVAARNARAVGATQPATPLGGTPPHDAAAVDIPPVEGDEGEEVRFARQLVSDYSAQLRAALRRASEADDGARQAARDDVTYWSRQFKEAMETFRKHKQEDRESQKSRGLLISRTEVECDVFAAAKMLANMRVSMAKRVVAELKASVPDLSEQLAELVTASIDRARAAEQALFLNLQSLKSLDDVTFRLEAA